MKTTYTQDLVWFLSRPCYVFLAPSLDDVWFRIFLVNFLKPIQTRSRMILTTYFKSL